MEGEMRGEKVSVTFHGSPSSITDLIVLASTVLEIEKFHHNDLPLALWHLLQQVKTMLDLALESGNYNPWDAQEWDERVADWRDVQCFCELVAKKIQQIYEDVEQEPSDANRD
jgi:hypothetical protein